MTKIAKSKKLLIVVGIISIIFLILVVFILPTFSKSSVSIPEFPKGRLRITQNEKILEIKIEVANTEELWEYGLMNRKSIPWKFGMLFVFNDYVDYGFWMKNTLVPLDIAFIDSEGKILNIQRMDPCEEENCKIYKSPFPYMYALEAKAGFFKRFGFKEGAKIEFWMEK